MVRRNTKAKLFTLVSLIMFGSSALFSVVRLFSASATQPIQQIKSSEQSSLQEQTKGYELVLQREPNNSIALEGLANARLQMHDLKGAIDSLEKLVKLNPNRSDYAALLAQAKQKGQANHQ